MRKNLTGYCGIFILLIVLNRVIFITMLWTRYQFV